MFNNEISTIIDRYIPKNVSESHELTPSILQQAERRQRIRKVCSEYAQTRSDAKYFGNHSNYNQEVNRNSFLIEEKSKTVYCVNHKAGSTTWMAVLANVHGDQELLERMRVDNLYYKYD